MYIDDTVNGIKTILENGIIGEVYNVGCDKGNDITVLELAKLIIKSIREGSVPGTHTTTYTSKIDDIEIKHTAHSRQGFALGSVVAAEWIADKTGVFSIEDM